MSDSEFRQKLARLQTLIAIKDAQLMANPKPYLEEMAARCAKLLKALDDVEHALSHDYVFKIWEEQCDKAQMPRPTNIQGEALLRCDKALEVLHKYRSS